MKKSKELKSKKPVKSVKNKDKKDEGASLNEPSQLKQEFKSKNKKNFKPASNKLNGKQLKQKLITTLNNTNSEEREHLIKNVNTKDKPFEKKNKPTAKQQKQPQSPSKNEIKVKNDVESKTDLKNVKINKEKKPHGEQKKEKILKKNKGAKSSPKIQKKAKANPKANSKKKEITNDENQNSSILENLPEFNEDEFNKVVTTKSVKKVVEELVKKVSEQIEKRNKQVFDDHKLLLNVIYFNIPSCPKRIIKLNLKHSLLVEDDDIIIFVRDLKGVSKHDYEPTIQHYENLFREKGITGIKTIMPFSQLKKEYGSFEMKKKLSKMYELYLCDAPLVLLVAKFLGKIFAQTRNTLYSIRMTEDLVEEVKKAKCKTSFRQGQKGPMVTITIGNNKMTPEKITENIMEIIPQLKQVLPGGLPNIHKMFIRFNVQGTSCFPIYLNMGKPPAEVPNVIGPKEKKLQKLAKVVNANLTKFHMTDSGELIPLSKNEIDNRKRKQEEPSSQEENEQVKSESSPKKVKKELKNTKVKDTVLIEKTQDKANAKGNKKNILKIKPTPEKQDEKESDSDEEDLPENENDKPDLEEESTEESEDESDLTFEENDDEDTGSEGNNGLLEKENSDEDDDDEDDDDDDESDEDEEDENEIEDGDDNDDDDSDSDEDEDEE